MNHHYRQTPKSGKNSRAKSPDEKEEQAGVGMQRRESELQCSNSLPKHEMVIAKMLFFTYSKPKAEQLPNYTYTVYTYLKHCKITVWVLANQRKMPSFSKDKKQDNKRARKEEKRR